MAINLKINLDSMMKLPMSRKLVVLAVINVVIIGLVYWFLTGPKRDEVASLKQNYEAIEVKLRESRVIAADIPKFQKEKEELEARLAAAVAQLPNEKEIPDLIDGISDAGEKSGLKILLFRPGREVKKGFYAEVPVNMSVEGRYEGLYNFSVKVGNLPRIVNIGGMQVQSLGHKSGVPILKADFVATTFRFIPTEGEGAPKK